MSSDQQSFDQAGIAALSDITQTSRALTNDVPDLAVMRGDDDPVASSAQNPDAPDISSVATPMASESDPPSPSKWPTDRIPVEIYNTIVQYLPRQDVQMMRLVNREFDAKLSEIYFSVVVVPFRPEFECLYGQLNLKSTSSKDHALAVQAQDEEDQAQDSSQTPVKDGLISTGHRVFQQFGDKMRKFALALEINENDLANPPLKISQEIHAAPWGLYRWPIMEYQRFSEVEGLERLANETGYMLQAFKHLKNINEIGISCDAGLGWLYGPDTNRFYAGTQPSVFRPISFDSVDTNTGASGPDTESQTMAFLKQMASNAGYPAEHWPRVILRLLEDEGRAGVTRWVDRTLPNGKQIRQREPTLRVGDDTPSEAIMSQIRSVTSRDEDDGSDGNAETSRAVQLVPRNLSEAQSEMLLELEWAHRALMQSYRLAILSNKNNFQNLKSLNIARCPSSRITTWCNEEFWETMTSIETFHLGVVPDWRQLYKRSDDTIAQWPVRPSNACQTVFTLLQSYVCEQQNIKNLSFEWVCGGELATGKSQRDRYILPAPVLSDSANMVEATHIFQSDEIINMPYITKLSLKNCWFSPHVFTFFFEHMFLEALEDVVLESVSLIGPPSIANELSIYSPHIVKQKHWPWPLCLGAEPSHWFQLQRPGNAQQAFQPQAAQPGPPAGPLVPQGLAMVNWAQGAAQAIIANAANAANAPLPAPINFPDAPTQPTNGPFTGKWRPWSWPHVLARLGMAPDAVHQYLEDGGADIEAHQETIRSSERRFARLFRNILDDRMYQGKHQAFKFKSCGYALVDGPHVNNWEIIPGQPRRVLHVSNFVSQIRDLDNQMLTTEDSLLAKILNYMPDEEEHFLQSLFGFRTGWNNVYDPTVKEAAMADGNPVPGEARFSGGTGNKPTTIQGLKQLLKGKGKPAELYRF